MTKRIVFLAILLTGFALSAGAQEPPVENPDQLSMLKSDDPQLAQNKKHVFDFWRIVYEGAHLDQASQRRGLLRRPVHAGGRLKA